MLLAAQQPQLSFLNHSRPVMDAHNCYPYSGQWQDRLNRALATGFPVGIEQDLGWYFETTTAQGRVVVTHEPKTTGDEPTLKEHFFERVRPIVETSIAKRDAAHWPLI